jgi:hypothetical protein
MHGKDYAPPFVAPGVSPLLLPRIAFVKGREKNCRAVGSSQENRVSAFALETPLQSVRRFFPGRFVSTLSVSGIIRHGIGNGGRDISVAPGFFATYREKDKTLAR